MAGLIERIARFVTEANFEDLPSEAIRETKRMLLDSIGCTIAGVGTDKGRCAVRVRETVSCLGYCWSYLPSAVHG